MIPTVERDESSMDHTEAGKKAAGFLPPDRTGQQTGQQSSVIVGDTGSHVVDVILSDMSEPWAQTDGFWKRSLSNPYYRMMNTSGMPFRDHAGSMVREVTLSAPAASADCSRCCRTCATLRLLSRVMCFAPGVTLSASFTRELKTRTWRNNSSSYFPRSTGRNPSPHGVYVQPCPDLLKY